MLKHLHRILFIAALTAPFWGCLTAEQSFTRVAPGIWRGVLELDKFQIPVRDKDTVILLYDQFKENELPFNFEVTYTDDERFYIEIINGQERIRLDSIRYGRDRTRARDTMNIYFPEYQTYLHAEIRGGVMQGEWVVTTKDNYRIPFYAHAGKDFRFTPLTQKPDADLSGEWAVLFGTETEDREKAIGEFRQQGNHLEGTFRTETGDYRFLEGTVQGRKFWLSCFDGSHAFLFSGSIRGDSLLGEFRSGTHYRTLWSARRDPSFHLGNPDSLTGLRADAKISFDLSTPQGRKLTFPSEAFDGKIKIFTVMGTWCPNCRDEQVFLRDYLKAHPDAARDISIVAFSFERHKDPAQANAHLLEYKRKMGIPFDIVYAGNASKADASKIFPALDTIIAFPTMVVLDKHNEVRRVHTGFDGPATSRYEAFRKDFDELIESLRR
ncbi:MAG: TlpA family protein disulfide reductase [Saprospiraceae bacterium]|nr:TlpA family protein disulfide reductase [Saprospiraceae bacterium]